jgi:hypothetical protein
MVHRPAADVYRFGEDVPAPVSFFHPAWHFKLLYPPSSAHASKPHSAFKDALIYSDGNVDLFSKIIPTKNKTQ